VAIHTRHIYVFKKCGGARDVYLKNVHINLTSCLYTDVILTK